MPDAFARVGGIEQPGNDSQLISALTAAPATTGTASPAPTTRSPPTAATTGSAPPAITTRSTVSDGNDILGGRGHRRRTAGRRLATTGRGYAQDELNQPFGGARNGWLGATDVVSIQGFGVTTFAQLQGLMMQSGADTVITFNTADILTIRNVLPGDWLATDFQLA